MVMVMPVLALMLVLVLVLLKRRWMERRVHHLCAAMDILCMRHITLKVSLP
jgi:hypothetical protein